MQCLNKHIEPMLVISTGHITPIEAEKLNNKEEPPFIFYDKEEYGWLMWIDQEQKEYNPDWPSLNSIHALAKERKFVWVMFDGDADRCEVLPHYEW